jgi:CxxC-x17-CxxC domain-containing protein
MEFADQTLSCRECGALFVFTAREQEFYQAKGFEHAPTRCPDCRSSRKGARRGPRETSEIVCAACGTITEVPFRPTNTRPVYCRDCYPARS